MSKLPTFLTRRLFSVLELWVILTLTLTYADFQQHYRWPWWVTDVIGAVIICCALIIRVIRGKKIASNGNGGEAA